MVLTIRKANKKDRVLQYGTVAATLLKDIGNASKQPYLQAIASLSLLIMETVQRVRDNKDTCLKMAERAYELVCAIINICHDKGADLAPAMVRSITQFSEILEKILVFMRIRMFRSMEDQTLITECNQGLKHALDVFGYPQVQSGIIAAMTMAEMQKDAKQRHEELIAILKERRSKPKRTSTSSSDGSGSSLSRRKRPSSVKTDLSRSAVSMLPASPKIFYGREEELTHVVNTITQSKPARIAICGADGLGKTALGSPRATAPRFPRCSASTDAKDSKQLIAALAAHLGVESTSKKHVIRHLSTLATETTPVLVVLDALDRAWKPHENRSDVEDFLSLLADLQYLTLIGTVRGSERPRQVKWTRPFLPTLGSLSPAAARSTFLDISGAHPEDLGLEELLTLAQNNPGTITKMAMLAWFEGTTVWDLERLGRRLGAFQTWVWAANAALFAASIALLALTGVSSSPVAQSFVILCGIFGLFGNSHISSGLRELHPGGPIILEYWNYVISTSDMDELVISSAVASLLSFMLSLGVQQAILDVRPTGNNDTRIEIDSPEPKTLNMLQLSGFMVTIVWSLSYVFMIHREIRRCTDSSSLP
ncbi:hypothetical protein B0H13DRAFT_1866362 [Mycena leptocephala]|nr:hypothetical protein B0H13DRAFT_1866362 [Mycena leptocephala]